jgi:hypothetical protein
MQRKDTSLIRVRPYEAPQVFFMGIGAAYLGLVDTLSKYGKLLCITI